MYAHCIDTVDMISEQGRLWNETVKEDSLGLENDPTSNNESNC